jgi:predicted O-methyltransferase YrrM
MENNYTIKEFVKSLNVDVPDGAKFLKLQKELTAYSSDIPIHYERGMLFYSLIAKFKPKVILEIGTFHGFSALCMAWAATDHNIDATIYTIEPNSLDKK